MVDADKIIHVDTLSLYHKYTEIFAMDGVLESDRIEAARQVANQSVPILGTV